MFFLGMRLFELCYTGDVKFSALFLLSDVGSQLFGIVTLFLRSDVVLTDVLLRTIIRLHCLFSVVGLPDALHP